MDVLEDLKLEVTGLLYTLTCEQLVDVCNFLEIAEDDFSDKGRTFLITQITQHMGKDEVVDLEDHGMSLFLSLKDKIDSVRLPSSDLGTPALDTLSRSDQAPTPAQPQPIEQLSEQQKLQKQIEALQMALQISLQSQQQGGQGQALANNQNTPNAPTQIYVQSPVLSPWHREFRIAGQIGEPGQKDKLTFSSLAHQIETGLNKKVPEYEIVHAVVKAITPGMQLRSYLEGKAGLTLPVLRRILRSHYQEKGATELYKQLTTEAQNGKETPQSFVFRVLDLRQKILFASQEAESGLRYDPILVQNMFLHSVLTGLQNDNIRNDMKPYLQADVNDEVLLEKLNIACMTETERQNKRKETPPQRSAGVHLAQCTEAQAIPEKKKKTPEIKNKPNLLDELKEIKAEIAVLKNLSTEVCQIRESIQHPQLASAQNLSTPGIDTCPFEHMPTGFWREGGRGRGGTTQFQQGYAPQRYPLPSSRGRTRRCFGCQRSGTDDICTHCFACGSSEHYFAGCRAREMTPRPPQLNERGLPPRDRE